MRRNPYFQGVYFFVLGEAHRLMGNYDEAVAGFEAYRDALPKSPLPLNMLAATYAEAGRCRRPVPRPRISSNEIPDPR